MLAVTLAPGALAPASADVGGSSIVSSSGPEDGFPEFFDDGNVKLRLCTDGPQCMAMPGTPEYFYYGVEATGGNLDKYVAGIEATYLNFSLMQPGDLLPPRFPTVVPGDEVGFGRLRFRVVNLVAGETYKITHPYGVNTFVAVAKEGGKGGGTGGEINQTIDVGCVVEPPVDMRPCDWDLVSGGFLGDYTRNTTTFLKQANAQPGYIGDILVPGPVTGAPSSVNAVIIEGPNAGGPGDDTLIVTDFAVQGQIVQAAAGTPSMPDLVVPTGRSGTDNIINTTLPTFTGTIEGFTAGDPPVTVDLLVDGVVTPAASTPTVNGKYLVALTAPLTQGSHSVLAEAAGLRSSTLRFTVETVPPVVTLGLHPTDKTAVTESAFTFTSDDPKATFECQLLPSIFVPCVSPVTFTALSDGDHTFNVRATDVAGNVSVPTSFPWHLDTLAPTATIESPPPPDNTGERTATFTFTSDDPEATFECQLLPSISTFEACTSPKTFAAQIDGIHTFKVRATDFASRVSAPATLSWRIGPPATVSTHTPVTNATGTSQLGDLTASFLEDVRGVSGETFTLTNPTGVVVGATVSATTRVATLNPTAALTPSTRYTATLSAGIKDADGNPITALSWSFTTGPGPTVLTKSPVVNKTLVAQAANLSAGFSENVSGLSRTTFTLRKAGTSAAVAATVSYNGTIRVATLNPTAILAPGTRYTATLSAGIKDADLNAIAATSWSFTTGPQPTVIWKNPAVNKTMVSRTANVTARFSENVRGVSWRTFNLKTSTGGAVSRAVSYNSRTHVVMLNPRVTLARNTRYTVTLSSLIKDADGNRISTTSWRFTTRR